MKAFDRFKSYLEDPRKKALQAKVRGSNPPLVPFCGLYLSNIYFLEEGNPLFLPHRSAAASPSPEKPSEGEEQPPPSTSSSSAALLAPVVQPEEVCGTEG